MPRRSLEPYQGMEVLGESDVNFMVDALFGSKSLQFPQTFFEGSQTHSICGPLSNLAHHQTRTSSEFHDWVDLGRKGTAGVTDAIQNRGSSQELEPEVTART